MAKELTGARLPNFLYIGPDKAGSSWLHETLLRHPEVYVTPAKDLYFFDRYFDRGLPWYARHFQGAKAEQPIIGEVCQDYLFCPEAAQRIKESLGEVRLMVTLRDPAERAFSSYLYMLKRVGESGSFTEVLARRPELIDRGRYATHLRRYLRYFDRNEIYLAHFDHLQRNPQGFFDQLLTWLGIDSCRLDPTLLAVRLPASRPRSASMASLTRRASEWTREHNGAQAVGYVKRSTIVQRALYKPFGDSRPRMSYEDASYIRAQLDDEISELERMFDIELRRRWGWDLV